MPPSEFRVAELSESGPGPGDAGQAAPNARVEGQFSNADVSQAHQYFTPKADTGLPNLSLNGDGGAGAAAAHVVGGGEQTIGSVAQAGSHAAIGAVTPGAEQAVNPMIQMIMKMPGLTGTLSSFFEFLGALFHGNILDALNPAMWAEHAMGAVNSLAANANHLMVSFDFIRSTNPGLTFNGMTFHPAGSLDGMRMHTDGVTTSSADAANVGAADPNIDLEQAIFEKTAHYKITEYHQDSMLGNWRHPQEIAFRGDANAAAYRPTAGGFQTPASTGAAPASPTSSNLHAAAQHPVHHAPAHHSAAGADNSHAARHVNHVKTHDVPLRTDKIAAQNISTNGGQYTIQSGDNLWNIAKQQLGDGSRWGEIYKANADVLGGNPDMITPGTTIHMPGGADTNIASGVGDSASYTVQPGDNLWSIAKSHLGGGQKWSDIYQSNHSVIGSDPGIIHPGQQLNFGGGAETHLASNPVPDHTEIGSSLSTPTTSSSPMSPTTTVSDTAATGMQRSYVDGLQAQAPQMAPMNSGMASTAGSAAAASTTMPAQSAPGATTEPQ